MDLGGNDKRLSLGIATRFPRGWHRTFNYMFYNVKFIYSDF